MGVETVIFDIRKSGAIEQAIKGNLGTVCRAHSSTRSQRQQWLSSGNIVRGKIQVKETALRALNNGEPLMLAGVSEIIEPFAKGEVFEILDNNRKSIAVARAVSSSDSLRFEDKQDHMLAKADEIILL